MKNKSNENENKRKNKKKQSPLLVIFNSWVYTDKEASDVIIVPLRIPELLELIKAVEKTV